MSSLRQGAARRRGVRPVVAAAFAAALVPVAEVEHVKAQHGLRTSLDGQQAQLPDAQIVPEGAHHCLAG